MYERVFDSVFFLHIFLSLVRRHTVVAQVWTCCEIIASPMHSPACSSNFLHTPIIITIIINYHTVEHTIEFFFSVIHTAPFYYCSWVGKRLKQANPLNKHLFFIFFYFFKVRCFTAAIFFFFFFNYNIYILFCCCFFFYSLIIFFFR